MIKLLIFTIITLINTVYSQNEFNYCDFHVFFHSIEGIHADDLYGTEFYISMYKDSSVNSREYGNTKRATSFVEDTGDYIHQECIRINQYYNFPGFILEADELGLILRNNDDRTTQITIPATYGPFDQRRQFEIYNMGKHLGVHYTCMPQTTSLFQQIQHQIKIIEMLVNPQGCGNLASLLALDFVIMIVVILLFMGILLI